MRSKKHEPETDICSKAVAQSKHQDSEQPRACNGSCEHTNGAPELTPRQRMTSAQPMRSVPGVPSCWVSTCGVDHGKYNINGGQTFMRRRHDGVDGDANEARLLDVEYDCSGMLSTLAFIGERAVHPRSNDMSVCAPGRRLVL